MARVGSRFFLMNVSYRAAPQPPIRQAGASGGEPPALLELANFAPELSPGGSLELDISSALQQEATLFCEKATERAFGWDQRSEVGNAERWSAVREAFPRSPLLRGNARSGSSSGWVGRVG